MCRVEFVDCSLQAEIGGLVQVGTPSGQRPLSRGQTRVLPMRDIVAEGEMVGQGKLRISTQEDLIWTKKPMSVAISNRLNALNSYELLARATDQT